MLMCCCLCGAKLNVSFIISCLPRIHILLRFCSVVAHPDQDGEVSGSSPGPTNDFKFESYIISCKDVNTNQTVPNYTVHCKYCFGINSN